MDSLFSSECLPTLLVGGVLGVMIAGALAYYYCFRTKNGPGTNINANLISNGEAMLMIERFMDCYNVKDAHDGTNEECEDDTVSGYLDIDVLLAYIDQMKALCTTAGKPMTGIEYYFAKYGDDGTINSNRNTIVMYPTYQGADEQGNIAQIPFDPDLSSDVVDIRKTAGARIGNGIDLRYANKYVLNRSNMSPPREPLTF